MSLAKGAAKNCVKQFIDAVRKGDLKTVQQIVAAGLHPNSARQEYLAAPALHVAAMQKQEKICAFLLEHGADVNARDQNNETALHYAFYGENLKIGERFIEAGADINAAGQAGPVLVAAAAAGNDKWVKFALDHGANPDLPDGDGLTPLAYACVDDYPKIVERLLAAGAAVNPPKVGLVLPISGAGRAGNVKTIKTLLDRGADVNAVPRNGLTALMGAVIESQTAAIKLLLEHGADPAIKGKKAETALDLAKDKPKLLELLTQKAP